MSVIDNLLSHYVTYCTDCISQMFINGYKWVTTTFLLATKLQICADATAWQRATLGCSSPCQAHRTTTCCIPTTTAVIISLYSGYHQHKNYSHISVRSDNATIWCSAQSYQVIRRLLCNTVLGKLVSKINCFIKCSFKYGFCKLLLTIRLCYSNSKMSPLPSAIVKLHCTAFFQEDVTGNAEMYLRMAYAFFASLLHKHLWFISGISLLSLFYLVFLV